jgi:hypothetical protein
MPQEAQLDAGGQEAERHEQPTLGPGDRQERQLTDVALQDHWSVTIVQSPLKTYAPAGVEAGVDEFRGEVVWQLVDAPPLGGLLLVLRSSCRFASASWRTLATCCQWGPAVKKLS